MAVIQTASGKLSTLKKELKDLLLKTYPSLTPESFISVPLYGSIFDSVIFVVLDATISFEELEDSDIEEFIKKKRVAGIGSLYSPAVWTLEPDCECLCDPEFETSLWGCDAEEEKDSIKELDPHGIFSKTNE